MVYLMIAKKREGIEWRITDNPLNKNVLIGVGLSNPASNYFLKYAYGHILGNVENFVKQRFTKLAKEWAADYGSDYIYLM